MKDVFSKTRILSYFLEKNKLIIVCSIFISFFDNFLKILITLSLGWYTSLIFQNSSNKLYLLNFFSIRVDSIHDFNLIFLILILSKIISTFSKNYFIGLVGERFSKFLRDLLFDSQMHQKLSSFKQKQTGKYLMRYSGDLIALQNFIGKGILVFIGDIVFIAAAIVILAYLDCDLLLLFLFISVLIVFFIYFLSYSMRHAIVERRNYRSILLGWVASRLYQFSTIKSFNRERKEVNSFQNKSENVFQLGKKVVLYSTLVKTLFQVYFYSTIITILWYINQIPPDLLVEKKEVFFSFLLLMLYLRSPLNRLSNVLIIWQVGLTSFNKLISIYNLPRENRRIQNPLKKLSSEIRLDSVSYLNDDYSVSRIGDLIIKSNSITQIFSEDKKIIDGLFNILQKKIEIVEGNVYFDEISIHELSEFEVRKNTTIISHDVPLLGATLIKAVSYNNQEKNKVKLLNLIKELDCDFLVCNEKDLSFKIGDSGEKLTINERILLQFIRAFMTNKNIILIDDVINQLAGVQKEKIIHKLNSLSLNKTIIFYSNHKITELNVARTIHL